MNMLLVAALALTFANDKPDLVYNCGETAAFTMTAKDDKGAPLSGELEATLDNFGPEKFSTGTWDLAKTNVFTISGTLSKPGFLRLTFKGKDGKFKQCWSVAYEPSKIRKGSPSPDDFDQFWADARKKLAAEVPLDPQVELVPERTTSNIEFYRISFATFGRRVYGYMSVPKSKGPFPVDFGVNAAGFGGWTNDLHPRTDAICVQFSVYPFPPDWRWKEIGLQAKYDEMNKAAHDKYGCGYASSGITESREAYFFYPVILGIDRAVDWVAARPDVDTTRFRYQGTSQGGGFGFYLCGLNRRFTRAAFFVPAITDTMGYRAGRASGWPRIVESNSATPGKKAAAEKWAPYFDGANFAARIACPVRVAVGFSHTTCPPCAVYAAFNEIKTDKDILHGFGMTHACYGKFYAELDRWIRGR